MTTFNEQLCADVDKFVKDYGYEPEQRNDGFKQCYDDSVRTFYGKHLPISGTLYRANLFPCESEEDKPLPEIFVTLHHFDNSRMGEICKNSVKICIRHVSGPEGSSSSFCATIEEAYMQALAQLCWETLHRPKTANYNGLRLRG